MPCTRISDHYSLHKRQPSLDFVDVVTHGDVRLFVDPRAIRRLETEWSEECVYLIQNFFETVILAIHQGDEARAKRLLAELHEPNETHLGLSSGEEARGRGISGKLAERVYDALSRSEAVKTGLLADLEDTILMVPGISSDIVSDISTNIIREPLIAYTQRMCREHGIPMEEEIVSGPLWDPHRHIWSEGFHVPLPVIEDRKLLLVPKSIVRLKMDYSEGEYYQHYILTHLQGVELSNPNSELIQLVKKTKEPHVYKKDVAEKYGKEKGVKTIIIEQTLKYPHLLEKYRREKGRNFRPPLSHEELSEFLGTEMPDWNTMLQKIQGIKPGNEHAHDYHIAVKDLLTALFYPHLDHPLIEAEINEGTKRIDIKFFNTARGGFFWWLGQNYIAPNVFIECKNYGNEIGNPEIDQMLGRFSRSRGEFGIITCRNIDDRERCTLRCRKTADDQSKYIIVLDDRDLARLVETIANGGDVQALSTGVLRERFDELTM